MKIITHSKWYSAFGCVLLFCLLNTDARAQANFALGTSSATGTNAFAAGTSSLAQGNASIAAGSSAQALGDFSISLGENTFANQRGAVAFGAFSSSQSEHSLAFGLNNVIHPNAFYSVVIGAGSHVYSGAWGGMAIGRDNFSHGASSVALGTRSSARTYGEIVLGAYSEDYTPKAAHSFEWHPEDRVFVIGNGFGDGAGNGTRQNALVMLKNGNTTLNGNLSLSQGLHIGADTSSVSIPEPGDIRYNFVTNDFEGYLNGIGWTSFTQSASSNSRGIGDFSKGRIFSWDMASSTPAIPGELDQDIIGITCVNISSEKEVTIGAGSQSGGIFAEQQGTMTITKYLDKSSVKLIEALHNAETINVAKIGVEIPAGGTGSGEAEYDYTYTLKRLKVTSYSFSNDDGANQPTETIVVSFDCYEIQDYIQDPVTLSHSTNGAPIKWDYTVNTATCN